MKLLIHKNRNDSAGSSDARLVGLDAARGVLLVLGVVLHAANIYTTGGKWIISDGQNNYIFDLLVGIIHEFRMPTFFWISGYFCALTCVRSGSEKMLQRRLPRLAIPLLASWLMLNSLQEGFVAWWNGSDPILVVLNGVPLFHLWFLVDLLIFIITLPLYLPWLRQISDRMMSRWSLLESPVIFIGLGVFGYVLNLVVRSTGIAYYDPLGITSLHRLSINIPFFVVGALMYSFSSLKEKFLRVPLYVLLTLIPLAFLARSNLQGHGLFIQELIDLSEKILVWGCIGGCLNLFNSVFTRSTWLTRLLAEASYTVFLFSHCLIVVTGTFMKQTTMPISVKFVVVSMLSLAISTLIHIVFIRKFSSLRLFFNGH